MNGLTERARGVRGLLLLAALIVLPRASRAESRPGVFTPSSRMDMVDRPEGTQRVGRLQFGLSYHLLGKGGPQGRWCHVEDEHGQQGWVPCDPTVPVSSPAPPLSPIRYLALGDSFTAGTGSSPEQSFPTRLAARWKSAGRQVVLLNLGVNGYSTDELIERELPQVKAFAPTRVTLAIGANDIVRHPGLDAYRAQLHRIFAALTSAGVAPAQLWVLPQPDWALSPSAASFGSPKDVEETIALYNAVLQHEAQSAGATYVDLGDLMQREAKAGEVAIDGLHPSAEAYDAWAGELARRDP